MNDKIAEGIFEICKKYIAQPEESAIQLKEELQQYIVEQESFIFDRLSLHANEQEIIRRNMEVLISAIKVNSASSTEGRVFTKFLLDFSKELKPFK